MADREDGESNASDRSHKFSRRVALLKHPAPTRLRPAILALGRRSLVGAGCAGLDSVHYARAVAPRCLHPTGGPSVVDTPSFVLLSHACRRQGRPSESPPCRP